MESSGLPTPLNYLIKSEEQLAAAAAHVGFPAVIKPISGAASIGVIRVNDVEQLKTSFARYDTMHALATCPQLATRGIAYSNSFRTPGAGKAAESRQHA